MTIQSEIREGVAKKCEAIWYSHDTDGIWGLMAGRTLSYLHSQGVVIKGQCLGVSHPHLFAYYTVEPLIKGA